ncbi:UvrD-helicase domain-containing protein [Flavobacterium gelidilacus]|uniref:UvrD-helicase domain-containing protein n=1 Tax=Flavobacterium gelidilacus TaxID=206041 RepID=UPI0003F6AB29|nr:UvrD-helicase domain-containing protein [Flavobacterium gelidilacus]
MTENKASFSIYNASAGSGKTYTLSKEYIKILLKSPSNEAYRKILAITFTNKAVEEMKSRIIFYLLEFSKEETSEKAADLLKDVAKETGLSIATIKDKSKVIIKSIIHNYTAFDISTIDRFTLKIIKSFSHELNIPLDFDISLETDLLMQEAIETVISKAGEDEELTKLLLDFSRNKTDDDKNWDITFDLLAASSLLTNEDSKHELKDYENKTIADFVETKKVIVEQIEKYKKLASALAQESLTLIKDNGIAIESFSRKTFPNHLIKIMEGNLPPSDINKFSEVEQVQINKTAKDKGLIESILPEILQKLQLAYKEYQNIFLLEAFNKNIYPLSLLNSINKEFRKIQTDQNILSISEFNEIINKEIQNQPAPFIYEKMGDRYRHFFIDEFQDTSVLQWKNLIPLVDNALSSEENGVAGTLMLVGDPKQAIYRWRGGKAEQFISLSKDENPFSNKDKETIVLDTNYRSYSQVIDFNNDFFKFISSKLENPDYVDLYLNNSHQNKTNKNGGYANISFIDTSDNAEVNAEEEDDDKNTKYLKQTLVTIEKVLKNGFQYKDMVLLTRTKSNGVLLANYLTENEIPILSSETLLIQNATEVKLIINVLKYINNKFDADAKFNMLYYVGKYLQSSEEIHDLINQNLHVSEENLKIALEKYDVSIDFNACRKKSLYEVVEIIVSAFIKQKANNSYVQYFLDLVLERHIKAQSSIADFIDYWERTGYKKSIPSPDGNNAIKIMTIHKSKGLEFPVVIYPFANDNYSKNNRNKLWVPLENPTINFSKVLIDNKKDVLSYSDDASRIYQEKNQEEILDNINVLYVAFTRAVEQLYVISEIKINKDGSLPNTLSSNIIEYLQLNKNFNENQLEYEFGNPMKVSKNEEVIANLDEIQVVQNKIKTSAIKIAQKEALMWGTIQAEAIEFGNTLHEILSYIKTSKDVSQAIAISLEKGLINQSQVNIIEEVIYSIVNNSELEKFYSKEAKIYNESSIIDENKNTFIPDRIAVFGEKVYLLDYKTGVPKESHKHQIEKYEAVLLKMGYIVEEKALVYLGENLKIIHL